MNAAELLTALRRSGTKKADIARALKLPPSRISEMYQAYGLDPPSKGRGMTTRKLSWDEGAELVREFGIGELPKKPAPPTIDLPTPIAKLAVLAVAEALEVQLDADDPRLAEIAADFRAFLRFVADPKVRESAELVEGFLAALRLRREIPDNDHTANSANHAG